MRQHLSRRESLLLGAAGLVSAYPFQAFAQKSTPKPLLIAAVVTEYRSLSHADVILTKILEGWQHDGKEKPALKLVSLYVDQFNKHDISREMCKKHHVPIFDTIEKAVTVGGKSIPVDGVLSIGEHGNYPVNELGQQLYPRRRFFQEITDTFAKYDRVVPVFNDKHISTVWKDAKWMYDRAMKMKVPFMAGSSLPLTFRTHPLDVPMGSEIESAVGIGYSGLDVYGFHALECYQSIVERRKNAEKGVKWVRYLEGSDVWKAVDDGWVSPDVMDTVYDAIPKKKKNIRDEDKAMLFQFEYTDGFRGAQFMLPSAGLSGVGVKIKGQKPIASGFEERTNPYYPHFAYLLKAIETMFHTGKATYPAERALLSGGILDRALTSKFQKSKKLDTPELAIAYAPVDYPHAPKPDLLAAPPDRKN